MAQNRYLVLCDRKHHAAVAAWLAANPAAEGYGLPVDDDLGFLEFEARLRMVHIWDYISSAELVEIDRMALEIAHTWYRTEDGDISRFSRISLGGVIKHPVMLFLVNRIKPLVVLPKLFTALELTHVVLFGTGSPWERAALALGQSGKLTVVQAGEPAEATAAKALASPRKNREWLYSLVCGLQERLHRMFSWLGRGRPEVAVVASSRTASLIRRILRQSDFRVRILVEGSLAEVAAAAFRHLARVSLTYVPPNAVDPAFTDKTFERATQALAGRIAQAGVPGLAELTREEAGPWLRSQLTRAARWEAVAFRHLASVNGRLLVVLQDFQGFQRALVAAAQTKSIRCLTQQHGAVGFYPHFVAPICDYVSVWSRKWAAWFTEDLRVDPARIRVITEPLYVRHIAANGSRPDLEWRRENHIPAEHKIVLYVYQPNPPISSLSHAASAEWLAAQTCAALSKAPGVHVLLKMHPSWPSETSRQIAAAANAGNLSVMVRADNFRLLQNTDVVITRGSTLAFEAALLGVPVIMLDAPLQGANRHRNPFLTGGFALPASSNQEAVSLTERFLSDPEFRKDFCAQQQENVAAYLDRESDFVDWLRRELGEGLSMVEASPQPESPVHPGQRPGSPGRAGEAPAGSRVLRP